MSTSELLPVKFHGDTLFCLTYQEQPFTPMKPLVENIGLAWQSQCQKLNANKERWGVTNIVIPSDSGDQEMVCMPVRKLPAYMNSINPKKVRAELRAKIELYQNESDDALWKYWTDGQAVRQSAHGDTLTATEQAQLQAIVQAKAGMVPADMQRKAFAEMWTRFNRHFRIARYAQLPPAKMGEAVEYLVGMEVKAAVAALPAAKEPVHVFKRMGLTALEELQMGTNMKRMFDGLDMDKIGPHTMEALVLKAKYMTAINEIYQLNRQLVGDLDRFAPNVNGEALKILNKNKCFSDPFVDTLYEARYRIDNLNEEYRSQALAALNSNICLAMMLGV